MLERVLPTAASVLDLGCGIGTDAEWLARRGHRVTAVDGAAQMAEATAERCTELDVTALVSDLRTPHSLPAGPFDAAVSNFGVLNCVRLEPVASALGARMRPRAPLVMVVMSHRCWSETVALLGQGHPREAWMRRRRPTAPVAGEDVPVTWLRADDVRRAFAADFRLEHREALGALLPPPGATGRRFHLLAPWLAPLDRALASWPVVRRYGDHTLYVLRRR